MNEVVGAAVLAHRSPLAPRFGFWRATSSSDLPFEIQNRPPAPSLQHP